MMESVLCYLLYVICLLGRRLIIYHLLSVICLLREETDRAVQKANTLEVAVNDGSVLCHLISVICYLSS